MLGHSGGGREGRELADGRRASARTTEDHEVRHRTAARPEHREGVHQHVGPLERLHATGEQHDPPGRVEPEPSARSGPVAGCEQLEIDARCDRVDAVRVRSVQLDEVARLLVGARDEGVGLRDHLLLPDHATVRLGSVPRRKGGVLDPCHRVHRVHERHVPPIGRQPPDLTGEPVVRVHDVVPARRPRGLRPQHPCGHRAQLSREIALVEPLERSCRHVVDQDRRHHADVDLVAEQDRAGLLAAEDAPVRVRAGQDHGLGECRRGRPREDLHARTTPGERVRQPRDVDVHPAGIADARLVQRRGVDRQHGDPELSMGPVGHRVTSRSGRRRRVRAGRSCA
ncbi:hypothetical protein GALL_483250 [mine drainage metagenome]|uniref:Uncharacterized protein n=1 Tax=mine drainage metagenome TaxID=410659 RepID=A0A1J5PFT5_9ZZZZ